MLAGGGNQPSRLGLRGRWRVPSRPRGYGCGAAASRVARFEEGRHGGRRTGCDAGRHRRLGDDPGSDRLGPSRTSDPARAWRSTTSCWDSCRDRPERGRRRGVVAASWTSRCRAIPGTWTWTALGVVRRSRSSTNWRQSITTWQGALQNEDAFQAMLADGEPAVDPALEHAWSDWRAQALRTGPVPGCAGELPPFRRVHWPWTAFDNKFAKCSAMVGLDKSTFKLVLRNQRGNWAAKVDLSRRGLDSVPPLPRDMKVLIMSRNPVRDWRNLPAGLVVLHARSYEYGAVALDLASRTAGPGRIRQPLEEFEGCISLRGWCTWISDAMGWALFLFFPALSGSWSSTAIRLASCRTACPGASTPASMCRTMP